MIERFIYIKNVGRFRNASPGTRGDCGEITLVDAPNGSGKTTLSAILHSLDQEKPGFITERDTVYTSNKPEVRLIYDGLCYEFDGHSWNTDASDISIEIFDTHFINTNLYAGDYFEHDHRKKLYQFIIGETAGSIDKEIRRIRKESSEISSSIRDKKEEIISLIEDDIDIEEFLDLEEVDNIEEKIRDQEKRVNQLERADMLRNRDNLDSAPTNSIPSENIERLLNQTLDDISKVAEERLRKHLNEHTEGASEAWINQGMRFIQDNNCPFCGTDTEGNILISSYREYFSQAYEEHKSDIDNMLEKVDSWLPAGGWHKIESTIDKNESVLDSWNEDIDFPEELKLSLNVDPEKVWKAIRTSVKDLLERKQSSPLVELSPSEDYEDALARFEAMNEEIKKYNDSMEKANNYISSFKGSLTEGDLDGERDELKKLTNYKVRYSEDGKKKCSELKNLNKKKDKLKKEKEEKRKKLDKVESDLMSKYHAKINDFLDKAGADFEIIELKKSMTGGNPSAKYAIKISGEKISLGSARTDIGEKGFRNILSEGDRNTLAFAFFYAKILTDPEIENKVVVIDDPVSSLDSTRRNATLNAIRKIYNISSQTIVLSHEPQFLISLARELDFRSDDVDSKIISISKKHNPIRSEIISIEPDDLKSKINDKYIKRLNKLKSFYYEEEDIDYDIVASSLRIVLESALSRRFPERNLSMSSTSAWENAIKEANPGSPLHALKGTPYHETLKELNSFIHGPHHGGELSGPPNRDKTELREKVNKTLDFVYGTL